MGSRVRYLVISILIASVPVVLMALASRSPGERGGAIEPLWQVVMYGAAEWYPWAFVAPLIDGLVRRSRPASRAAWGRLLARHAMLLLAFAAVHAGVVFAATMRVDPAEGRPFGGALAGQFVPDAVLYLAIAAGFTIAESRRRQTEMAERLRSELAEARLDALRQQLNPHFLFNTLNYIVTQLRTREIDAAERMLLALGDLLHDVLRERAQLIPLRDEMRMVERYLEIARERFGERLQAEVTFEPKALDALVPSLILQPLLENAVRHGVSTSDGRCRVSLAVRTTADRLTIDVRDAGPGIDPAKTDAPPGIGIGNTSERLKYLYGADHTFQLKTLDGGGLLVAIDLPFRRS